MKEKCRVKAKGKQCTVDCNKDTGNTVYSRPFACGLPSLLPYSMYIWGQVMIKIGTSPENV